MSFVAGFFVAGNSEVFLVCKLLQIKVLKSFFVKVYDSIKRL